MAPHRPCCQHAGTAARHPRVPARAMNLQQFDLNLFVTFDVIFAERNLTRAGERLHITQPAVSNALARLRSAFNDPLFVHQGGTMVPTGTADRLIGPVRQSLALLRGAVEDPQRFDPAQAEQVFQLSLRDSACAALAPALVVMLEARAPRLTLHCRQLPREQVAQALVRGQVDLAIDIDHLPGPALQRCKLFDDAYVVLMRPGHPLADAELTLARFLAAEHVLITARPSGPTVLDQALARRGLPPAKTVLRVPNAEPAISVVRQTDLLLTAPRSLAQRHAVCVRPLPLALPPLTAVLYWHAGTEHAPAHAWLRGLVRQAAAPFADASGTAP